VHDRAAGSSSAAALLIPLFVCLRDCGVFVLGVAFPVGAADGERRAAAQADDLDAEPCHRSAGLPWVCAPAAQSSHAETNTMGVGLRINPNVGVSENGLDLLPRWWLWGQGVADKQT